MTKPNALSLFVPICKVDEEKRLVYGMVTREEADAAGEVLDYETSKAAFSEWSTSQFEASDGKSYGNMRAMHGKVAAGKFVEPLTFDDDLKAVMAVGKVVDDAEWNKVMEGVYTGFSIGGNYAKRWVDPENPTLTRYTPTISEISIVDNPCVKSATFDVVKADGSTELRKFKTGAPEMTKPAEAAKAADTISTPDLEQVWKAKDGSTHPTKAAALKKNAEVDAAAVAAPAEAALASLEKHVSGEGEGEAAPATTEAPAEVAGEAEVAKAAGAEEAPAAAEPVAKAEGEAEPAAAEETAEKAAGGELTKSLYDVNRCANLLCDARWLADCMQSDVQWANGNAELADKAKAAVATIAELLVSIVGHETAEITKAAEAHLAKFAAPADAADEPTALEKATMRGDALEKALAAMTPRLDEIQKRLTAVEQQPQAPKGSVRVVAKGSEGGDAAETAVDLLAKMSPQEQSMAMMKASLRSPQVGIPA